MRVEGLLAQGGARRFAGSNPAHPHRSLRGLFLPGPAREWPVRVSPAPDRPPLHQIAARVLPWCLRAHWAGADEKSAPVPFFFAAVTR